MTALTTEEAYRAVMDFLGGLWERTGRPEELGLFLDMASCSPGVGTADPAIWTDWLAWVKKLQTGVLVPERRSWLKGEAMKPLDSEQAYLAMVEFLREYWERVGRPPDIGDLLGQLRYTPGAGPAVPDLWQRWLTAVEKVQADRANR